jgi:DNA polymerase III sliding clamp (beta) subunit (PCNA family)
MNRTDLIAALKSVEASLSTKDFIPVLACFCFDGDYVLAYDDVTALQAPCKIPFKGALRGKVLLPLLQASRAKEVEIEDSKNEVQLTAGRSRFKLPKLSSKEFIFTFPDTDGAQEVPVSREFLDALIRCRTSMNYDPSEPWKMGCTLVFGEEPTLYSTDNKTASKANFRDKNFNTDRKPMILPPRFVEHLLAITKSDPAKRIRLHKNWIEVRFESGLRLFSLSVKGVDVGEYTDIFDRAVKDRKKSVIIPKGFERCLDRANVLTSLTPDPYATFSVKDDRILMRTETDAGNANDSITFIGQLSFDPIKLTPALIQRGISYCSAMYFNDDYMMLSGDFYVYLVSTIKMEE